MVGCSRGDQMGRVAAAEDGLLRKTQTEERKGGSEKGVGGSCWRGRFFWGLQPKNAQLREGFSGLVTMFFTYIFILHAFLLSFFVDAQMIFVAWEWVRSYFANGSLLKFSLPGSDFCMRCFVPLFYLLFGAHLISSTLVWAHWSLYEMRLVWVSFTPTRCALFFFSIFPCFGYLVMECIILLFPSMGAKSYRGCIFSGE